MPQAPGAPTSEARNQPLKPALQAQSESGILPNKHRKVLVIVGLCYTTSLSGEFASVERPARKGKNYDVGYEAAAATLSYLKPGAVIYVR